jgi:hypothetical protein
MGKPSASEMKRIKAALNDRDPLADPMTGCPATTTDNPKAAAGREEPSGSREAGGSRLR